MDDVETGRILPVLQALVTGIFVGLAGGGLAQYAGWNNPPIIGLLFGCFSAAFWWFSGVLTWRKAAYPPPYPAYTEQDNRVYPISEPVRVELVEGKHIQLIDLPATPEQLAAFAKGILQGLPLAEAAWTGAGGVFTRSEYQRLRAELIRRGLVEWNSPATPARGASLTAPGRAIMRS